MTIDLLNTTRPKTKETKETENLKDVADTILDDIKNQKFGVLSGFPELDLMTRGFFGGELTIIASRPSMGKSSLMLDMALRAWMAKYRVMVLSLEMSLFSVKERVIANLSRVPLDSIKYDMETAEERERLAKAIDRLKNKDFVINASGGLKPSQIREAASICRDKHGLDIIFVDYLQLLRPDIKSGSRQQEITDISMDLKDIAMRLDMPVVALSQLSRANEHRDDHRPRLSDLRESGSLEQDAHKVILLHREDYYRQREDKTALLDGKAECILAKNRQGPTGDITLCWIPKFFTFEEPNQL